MPEPIAPGEVWLVGAGPGDPELLTRKAERLLGAASVVFYDALVGEGVLELAPQARLVHVGKRSGRHSKDQTTIDALIVEAALQGERVVRLKGGDPSIFGRSTEELEACRTAGVPVRICPGVTAASAAAAQFNFPLTHRGLARRVVFATARIHDGSVVEEGWSAKADAEATLALYMARDACGPVADRLIAAGRSPATPAIAIENAGSTTARLVASDLAGLAARLAEAAPTGPVLLVVGEVAALAQIATEMTEPARRAACM